MGEAPRRRVHQARTDTDTAVPGGEQLTVQEGKQRVLARKGREEGRTGASGLRRCHHRQASEVPLR